MYYFDRKSLISIKILGISINYVVIIYDNFNYSANTIRSPIYIFSCPSVILDAIIRILLTGMDV